MIGRLAPLKNVLWFMPQTRSHPPPGPLMFQTRVDQPSVCHLPPSGQTSVCHLPPSGQTISMPSTTEWTNHQYAIYHRVDKPSVCHLPPSGQTISMPSTTKWTNHQYAIYHQVDKPSVCHLPPSGLTISMPSTTEWTLVCFTIG